MAQKPTIPLEDDLPFGVCGHTYSDGFRVMK